MGGAVAEPGALVTIRIAGFQIARDLDELPLVLPGLISRSSIDLSCLRTPRTLTWLPS